MANIFDMSNIFDILNTIKNLINSIQEQKQLELEILNNNKDTLEWIEIK